jgi:hypothetical protein
MTDTGAPRALLANAITGLRLAPEWEGALGFDEFRNRCTQSSTVVGRAS